MWFTFEKGGKSQAFITRGSLFEPYPEAGIIPFGMGGGLEPGAGFSLDRYQDGRTETDPLWFLMAGKTEGVVECPGKQRAWKFRVEETGEEPDCNDSPRQGPKRWR